MASSSRNRQWKRVAVVYSGIGEHSCELLRGIAQYVQEHRHYTVYNMFTGELRGARPFRDHRLDGIIANVCSRAVIGQVKEAGVPVVDLSGQMEDDPEFISVDQDPVKLGTMVAERFIQRGFTSFAYYGIPDNRFCEHHARAFTATVEKARRRCSTFFRYRLSAETRKPFREWVASLPPHTAVFCMNDSMAEDLLKFCLQLGRAVPDDIAIMGEGNEVALCTCQPVTLSSIDDNWRGLGYAAMRIMANVLKNPVAPKRRRVFRVPPGSIVERESTAIYPVDPPWLADALSLLDTGIDRPLTTADLAEAAKVSQPTLQAAFHKTFGTSAGRYILSVKMREAKRLVDEGYLTVKEIAARIGFTSRSYFSRTYSEYYGRPPSGCSRSTSRRTP